jgi:hypothetical protein
MNQNRITNILLAGFILVALIVCGVIGYMNDSGRFSPNAAQTEDASPTAALAEIELGYCYSPVNLCVISFGSDNAGNILIVIKNKIPELVDLYTKINQPGVSNLYTCQKVKFTPEVYYCLGDPIADGTTVKMEVYSKNDDKLVASGSLLISFQGTPAPTTETATETADPSSTEMQTNTPDPSAIEIPTSTPGVSATETPALYP